MSLDRDVQRRADAAPTIGLPIDENVGDATLVDLQHGAGYEELAGMDVVNCGASAERRAGDRVDGSESVGDGVHGRDYHTYVRRTKLSRAKIPTLLAARSGRTWQKANETKEVAPTARKEAISPKSYSDGIRLRHPMLSPVLVAKVTVVLSSTEQRGDYACNWRRRGSRRSLGQFEAIFHFIQLCSHVPGKTVLIGQVRLPR